MNTGGQGVSPASVAESLASDLAEIEVALDICNNISGIISEQIARIRSVEPVAQHKIDALNEIRWRFLRTEQESFARGNMEYVRAFIREYAPQVKACFETGQTPSFLNS